MPEVSNKLFFANFWSSPLLFLSSLLSLPTHFTSSSTHTLYQSMNDNAFGFHFSASAAIDRFMALHRRSDHQQPSSTSATNSEATTPKKGKAKFVPTTIKDTKSHHPYKIKGKSDRKNSLPPDQALPRTEKAQEQARQEQRPQTFQPPPPNRSERHRYIASGYLLQNTGLVRALRDPTCAHADLVERDFTYLQVIFFIFSRGRTRYGSSGDRKRERFSLTLNLFHGKN